MLKHLLVFATAAAFSVAAAHANESKVAFIKCAPPTHNEDGSEVSVEASISYEFFIDDQLIHKSDKCSLETTITKDSIVSVYANADGTISRATNVTFIFPKSRPKPPEVIQHGFVDQEQDQ